MKRHILVIAIIGLIAPAIFASPGDIDPAQPEAGDVPTVVHFDDLSDSFVLTGSGYAGLTWEGDAATGQWQVPGGGAYPAPPSEGYTTSKNITNSMGITKLGIGFGTEVDVLSVHVAAQGNIAGSTDGIRIQGYLDGEKIEEAITPWFTSIGGTAVQIDIDLYGVDRIVIESQPETGGKGYYAIDNLTYSVPEPATLSLMALGGLALIRRRK